MSWAIPRTKECTCGRSASRAAVVHAANRAALSLQGEQCGEGTHNAWQCRHFGAGCGQGVESFAWPFGEIPGPGQQQTGGPT
jgi:hypothetical protein